MKMIKYAIAIASLGMAVSSFAQQTYDFSYTFLDGVKVTGVLQGTPAGNFVDNVSVSALDINGVPVAGPIYNATWNGTAFVNSGGAVVSLTGDQNDLLFINSDYANGHFGYTQDFYSYNDMTGLSGAISDFAHPTSDASWSLVSVPDGSSTAILCGMSLMGLGWFRRKLA